jgi:hypothetical protein
MMDMGVGIRRGNLSKLKSDQAKSAWWDAGKKNGGLERVTGLSMGSASRA